MKTIIDISWPITSTMTSYKNSKPVTIHTKKNFIDHGVRDSEITLNCHTGTHIDAPAHFLEHGDTINAMTLKNSIGPCIIIDLPEVTQAITAEDLMLHPIKAQDIVLLRTKNSFRSPTETFDASFVYLDKTGAQFLADKNITAVGIDYLGIEREQLDHETHTILFRHNITIIEGLRLGHISLEKKYHFYCLPLALQTTEAAPARAILIEQE